MRLSELENCVEGIKVIRDADFETAGFINMDDLDNKLVFARDDSYLVEIEKNNYITCLVTTAEVINKIQRTDIGLIEADKPDKLFYKIHNYLAKETDFYGQKKKKTVVGSGCTICSEAKISEFDVEIGDNVIVEAGAVILPGVKIGNNCVIGANSTIGTRGFQYYRDEKEAFYIEHIGGVIIEDNVDILSNSCVATGLIRPTIIHKYAKIDNLVHVGHSAEIGERCLITAGAIIGGSSKIGKRVWVGINSVMKAESVIEDDAFICMGAVVTRSVNEGQKVSGNFAIDHRKQIEFIKKISENK